jgi:hypothetical protein
MGLSVPGNDQFGQVIDVRMSRPPLIFGGGRDHHQAAITGSF